MKNNKKLALAAATFGIAALAMGGSTFAWFTVVNTANVALQGTIVGVDDRLEVGFRTETQIPDALADFGLIEEVSAPGYIYWAPNTVTANVMAQIITASGYNADNELTPITTGSFDSDLATALPSFFLRPEFSGNVTNADPLVEPVTGVTKSDYIGFTMIFKAVNESGVGVPSLDIHFD
ncbi:MAG TPA: hypothetical protein DCX17_02210, partial [Firmicutes bacterium]|nr:hypothetical protein [Bacillota bacterium]